MDGYLLIDTSYPQYYSLFKQKIERFGIQLSEIKYLLLTHHHDDHAGFAAQLVQETECKVIAHKNAVLPLKQGASEETMQPVNQRIKIIFVIFTLLHKKFTFPPLTLTERDILIEQDNKEILKNLGIDGQIIHTPGHTHDSISVVLSGGQAFVGDVAMNFLHGSGIHYRPIYIEDINAVY
jgi:glyoxylase-like metal-dependent hydrolase (beta-lactamase superfamily II)